MGASKMKKIKLQELELYILESGSGEPLILVHGLGSDHTIWDGILPLFSENYHVVAMDLRGHGFSTKSKGIYSMELFADDIIHLIDNLGIKEAHFIGQSMGGAIVQQIALKYPENMISMTLISTFSFVDPPLRDIFLNLEELAIQNGYSDFFKEAVRLTNTPQFIQDNKTFLEERMKIMEDMSSISSLKESIEACRKVNFINSLPTIMIPTLIMAGADDILTPPHHAREIHKAIPHSQIKILENIGHNLIVELPNEAYQIIKEFLDKNKIK
jgi:3-oxoadipate enol-lactonase